MVIRLPHNLITLSLPHQPQQDKKQENNFNSQYDNNNVNKPHSIGHRGKRKRRRKIIVFQRISNESQASISLFPHRKTIKIGLFKVISCVLYAAIYEKSIDENAWELNGAL